MSIIKHNGEIEVLYKSENYNKKRLMIEFGRLAKKSNI